MLRVQVKENVTVDETGSDPNPKQSTQRLSPQTLPGKMVIWMLKKKFKKILCHVGMINKPNGVS